MTTALPGAPGTGGRGPDRLPQPRCAEDTPLAWRIASLGILLGAGLVGRAAGHSRMAWAALVPLVGSVAWGTLRIGRASHRVSTASMTAHPSLGDLPEVTVVIPARDEVEVVTQLIGDLARQDHRAADGSPRFEIVVVDDRSIDGTGRAVERHADAVGLGSITRVVRREGRSIADGKGAALADMPPEQCREVIIVLDADARIKDDFLRRAAAHIAGGIPAVQARRRVLGAEARRLARLQADEQTLDGAIQRGRWETGGCSEFRGNGMVIRRDVIVVAGGWPAGPLTEDLDLSDRIAAMSGLGIPWVSGLEVWESPVERLGDLWVQRLRWAEGSIRRYLERGPAVLASRRLSRTARLDFAFYGGQLLVPPFLAGLVAGAAVDRRADLVAITLGSYGVGGLALAYQALGHETTPAGSPLERRTRVLRAGAVTLFESLWILVVPAALLRLATRCGPLRFIKTPHHAQPWMVPGA